MLSTSTLEAHRLKSEITAIYHFFAHWQHSARGWAIRKALKYRILLSLVAPNFGSVAHFWHMYRTSSLYRASFSVHFFIGIVHLRRMPEPLSNISTLQECFC